MVVMSDMVDLMLCTLAYFALHSLMGAFFGGTPPYTSPINDLLVYEICPSLQRSYETNTEKKSQRKTTDPEQNDEINNDSL